MSNNNRQGLKNVLEIKNLSLDLNQKRLLNDVNLTVCPGEVIAILGPNGAGKSSLIDVITGSLKPVEGNVSVMDKKFNQVKDDVGVLYEQLPTFPMWKVKEYINYIANIYNTSYAKIKSLLYYLEINQIEDKLFKVLSKGEKKRVGILIAIIHNPQLLILDEPTSDLDPFIRQSCWNLFTENKERGILFTTHMWDEAEKYADRIAFFNNGQITTIDTPINYLSSKYIKAERKIILAKQDSLFPIISNYEYIEDNDNYHVYADDANNFLSEVQSFTNNYSFVSKSLQDVYSFLHKK